MCFSGRGGHRDSPDSVQFECEYRAVATGLMFKNSEKTNCEEDLDTFLLQVNTFTESQESNKILINTDIIRDEHSYARKTSDGGAAGDQVEEPMDQSNTDNLGDHGKSSSLVPLYFYSTLMETLLFFLHHNTVYVLQ